MSDDYLWDRSGEPDPEVKRLEELLGRFRHQPAQHPWSAPSRFGRFKRRRTVAWMALAAAATILFGFVGIRHFLFRGSSGWEVLALSGAPRVGSAPIGASGRMREGDWLATDGESRARIRIGEIGEAEVESNSRVGLVRAATSGHRMALAVGTIQATIWAPPRFFSVDTPSATAVDLGCTYTLSVDESGGALLHVTSGWVAWDHKGRETFVPAGAQCATRLSSGPGSPYFEDATTTFRDALHRIDFIRQDDDARRRNLVAVLNEARPRDGLTLWHLLASLEGSERGEVYDRLAALIPPPAGATRAAVIAGNREILDAWWDELDLGSSSFWRLWKHPTAPG